MSRSLEMVPGTFSAAEKVPGTIFWMAAATCGVTFVLILVGALVTSFGVGMAVPDWPTTFGENMLTYSFLDASWGVRLEHGHRLLGALVGLMALVLALWIWVTEESRLLRGLAIAGLLAVVFQGILGGLRVVRVDPRWGVVHGAFAQAFFGITVALAYFVGAESGGRRGIAAAGLAWISAGMVYLQIVSGSVLRHLGVGLWLHLLLAVGVVVHAILLVRRQLSRLALACAFLVGAQLFLGLASWITARPPGLGAPVRGEGLPALFTTLHVAAGSLLFACALLLALRTSFQPSPKLDPREAAA